MLDSNPKDLDRESWVERSGGGGLGTGSHGWKGVVVAGWGRGVISKRGLGKLPFTHLALPPHASLRASLHANLRVCLLDWRRERQFRRGALQRMEHSLEDGL